jgi:hypothetical protein
VIGEHVLDILLSILNLLIGRYSIVDPIPAELLELQTRFESWRANRKYVREPIPNELRSTALEMLRRYPPSVVHRVLKVDPSRLKKMPPAKHPKPREATPKKKTLPPRPGVPNRRSKSSTRAQVATWPQPAFFKLPAVAALPGDFSSAHTPTLCRLQLERGDGSRLTLTLPGFDASIINSLVADFLRGRNR